MPKQANNDDARKAPPEEDRGPVLTSEAVEADLERSRKQAEADSRAYDADPPSTNQLGECIQAFLKDRERPLRARVEDTTDRELRRAAMLAADQWLDDEPAYGATMPEIIAHVQSAFPGTPCDLVRVVRDDLVEKAQIHQDANESRRRGEEVWRIGPPKDGEPSVTIQNVITVVAECPTTVEPPGNQPKHAAAGDGTSRPLESPAEQPAHVEADNVGDISTGQTNDEGTGEHPERATALSEEQQVQFDEIHRQFTEWHEAGHKTDEWITAVCVARTGRALKQHTTEKELPDKDAQEAVRALKTARSKERRESASSNGNCGVDHRGRWFHRDPLDVRVFWYFKSTTVDKEV